MRRDAPKKKLIAAEIKNSAPRLARHHGLWVAYLRPDRQVCEMPYWVQRIVLDSGEVVTERELQRDENYSDETPPLMGDRVTVTCRGRSFIAEVIKGPTKEQRDKGFLVGVYPLRVSEVVEGIPSKPKWLKRGERTIRLNGA